MEAGGPPHPGADRAALQSFEEALLEAFQRLGHRVSDRPGPSTDIALTCAVFLAPVPWRKALFFTGRIRHRMPRHCVVYALVPASKDALEATLSRIAAAAEGLAHEDDSPARKSALQALSFEGLAPESPWVLAEQAARGGPLLALARVVQAQAKCIRVALVVHEEGDPDHVYLFDLVGGRPRVDLSAGKGAYEEVATRMATVVSLREVTDHVWSGEPIPQSEWESAPSVAAMARASRELGRRGFFAEPVHISTLVHVPVVSRIVAEQYSEGCFATYEGSFGAQVVTATGTSRTVHKGAIAPEDLCAVVGVKSDLSGAVVRPVSGRPKTVPSSEAVDLYAIDTSLPSTRAEDGTVRPVTRSKLHGHCGVVTYDASVVEHVPVADAYQRYPVSCGTDAQVRALVEAFSRSEALRDPDDPRMVVFTQLPGHGCFLVEKWSSDHQPFELIWRLLDSGGLVVDPAAVPQGPYDYRAQGSLLRLRETAFPEASSNRMRVAVAAPSGARAGRGPAGEAARRRRVGDPGRPSA